MSGASGLRIVVAIMLMGVCGWLIYGVIVGGASAEERDPPDRQRATPVATRLALEEASKADAPKARPGHPGPNDDAPNGRPGRPGPGGKPPADVPPKAQRTASSLT